MNYEAGTPKKRCPQEDAHKIQLKEFRGKENVLWEMEGSSAASMIACRERVALSVCATRKGARRRVQQTSLCRSEEARTWCPVQL